MTEQGSLKRPVLVTGGSGYIASWVVKTLLDEGMEVRATVRNKSDKNKVEHLLNVAQSSDGKLTLHEADLLKDGSFGDPMEGCEAVFHMASPASPIDYLELPIQTLKVGSLGTHKALGLAKDKNARLLLASTSEVKSGIIISQLPFNTMSLSDGQTSIVGFVVSSPVKVTKHFVIFPLLSSTVMVTVCAIPSPLAIAANAAGN